MRALSSALLAFVGSLLLVVGITSFWLGEGVVLPLKVVQGGGSEQTRELMVDLFQQGRAVVSSGEVSLSADEYPFLNYRITGPIDGMSDLLLFWRSREKVREISTRSLPVNPIGFTNLNDEPEWRGNISEIGFILYGDSGQVYRLQMPRLYPEGWASRLLWYISGWLEFEPWSPHSINFMVGGRRDQQLYLPLLILLLVVLFWVAELLFRRTRKSRGARWYLLLAITLAGWLLLDARWLFNQFRQFQLTSMLFAGRSEQQRQLRGEDGDLYGYAARLKRDIFPERPTRIFIISEAPANDYERLRIQYHLAPHNVFNYSRLPQRTFQKTGGYIIVLESVKGLSYDGGNQALRWGRSGSLKATLVDRGAWATLYKIEKE